MSSETEPTTRTTLAIVLGASRWRDAPKFEDAASFERSADAIINFLREPNGLGLPWKNIKSLFNSLDDASEQLEQIASFIERHQNLTAGTDESPRDLLLFYVGHGDFEGEARDFYLTIRRTHALRPLITSITAHEIGNLVRRFAGDLRTYMIIDCCFAAALQHGFMTSPLGLAELKLHEALPPGSFESSLVENDIPASGVALLAAAGLTKPAIAPSDHPLTAFTAALLDVLHRGHARLGPRLSLQDVHGLVERRISELFPDAARPEIRPLQQSRGRVELVSFFPNPAFQLLQEERRRLAAETARLTEERPAGEVARLAEEQRQAEDASRLSEEKRRSQDATRLEEEKRQAEEAARRTEEKRRAEEAARLAWEIRLASGRSRSVYPENLGLLEMFAGSWVGDGFSLVALPNFHDGTDVYLQLNRTREHLQFASIGSALPVRGFGQDDIEVSGLTYSHKVVDAESDRLLHTESGVWMTQPNTSFPPDAVAAPDQLVARMAAIPHGTAFLAQGLVQPFAGPPVVSVPSAQYSFSYFPSFNSTPFLIPPTAPFVINSSGSSEKSYAASMRTPPFPQYDLTIPIGPIPPGAFNPPFTLNTRTPFGTSPPQSPMPAVIDGIHMQDIVNDPILLLQNQVSTLLKDGYSFEGTVVNISTESQIHFGTARNSPIKSSIVVSVPQFGGTIGTLRFLQGFREILGDQITELANAEPMYVYGTIWISKVTRPGEAFMQLQYAQMVVLRFPIFHLLHSTPPLHIDLGWPHISVGTLRKEL